MAIADFAVKIKERRRCCYEQSRIEKGIYVKGNDTRLRIDLKAYLCAVSAQPFGCAFFFPTRNKTTMYLQGELL